MERNLPLRRRYICPSANHCAHGSAGIKSFAMPSAHMRMQAHRTQRSAHAVRRGNPAMACMLACRGQRGFVCVTQHSSALGLQLRHKSSPRNLIGRRHRRHHVTSESYVHFVPYSSTARMRRPARVVPAACVSCCPFHTLQQPEMYLGSASRHAARTSACQDASGASSGQRAFAAKRGSKRGAESLRALSARVIPNKIRALCPANQRSRCAYRTAALARAAGNSNGGQRRLNGVHQHSEPS